MRTVVVDYAQRAEECRRLAAQYTTRVEHWVHFREMAETWEMLHRYEQEKLNWREELKLQKELKHQQEKSRVETIALADQFRGILLLSDTAPNGSEANNNEKATDERGRSKNWLK